MLLFQDTESTGLLDFKKDIMDFSQPRICSLAASLTDEEGNIIDEMDVLIKPDGWVVEDGASAVNGLTAEICEAGGIPMPQALARYNELKAQCTKRIGANASYDKRLLLREANIYGIPHDSEGKETLCVLQLARPYCKLAPSDKMMAAGYKENKLPKLGEAYHILIGEPMKKAHSAMGDVRGVQAVYFEVMRRMRGGK